MSLHQRQLIREAVEARLKGAGTMAGVKVFGNRAAQIFPAELPVILVYTKNEPVDVAIESPREYKRNLVVSIELVASAQKESTLDDTLDAFANQVERAMLNTDETFGGLVTDTLLGDTEIEQISEGEKPVGAVKISFAMPYYQQFPEEPEETLDPFETANTEIDLPPADETIEATDTVTLEQTEE